ncbi:MAG: glutathione S-transferase N-terminal domain-containing protein [Pseudomonadota bacterium]
MIKIYHVPYTRSVRPIWLCHEMGLDHEIIHVDWSDAYKQSDGWRAISPTQKVPVMQDGDLTMFESGAMVAYLLEKYGQQTWLPEPGTAQSALHHQWCWYSEASLPRPLGVRQVLRTRKEEVDLPTLVESSVRKVLLL